MELWMVAGRETDLTCVYSHSDFLHHCHYKSLRLDGQHRTMGHLCPLDDQIYSRHKQRNCYHCTGLSLLHSCTGIHYPSHWPLATGIHWPGHWSLATGIHWPGHWPTPLHCTVLLACTGHYTGGSIAGPCRRQCVAPAGDRPVLQSRPDWPAAQVRRHRPVGSQVPAGEVQVPGGGPGTNLEEQGTDQEELGTG